MSTLFYIIKQQQQQALSSIKRHCNIVRALQYKFVPSHRMSYTLTYVQVALAFRCGGSDLVSEFPLVISSAKQD